MARILSAIGHFAKGYADEKRRIDKDKHEKEMRDLQLARARDEKAMNDEIKNIASVKIKPSEAYVVMGADGTRTVYADARQAHDAAAVTAGAQVQKKIVVADKQYDDPEEAGAAAESLNSPLAKARMAAQVGAKYNRPDVFEAHMKSYKMGVDANRADMLETVMMAQQLGDPKPALEAYNKRLPNGKTAELVQGENGAMALQIMQKGQPVGQPRPIGSMDEFFKGAIEFVSTTPDNQLEIWKHKSSLAMQGKGLELQGRQVDIQGRVADANIEKTEAEIAQMPEELKLKRQQVGAAVTSAGASATSAQASVLNAQTNQMGLTMPKVISGVNEKDEVVLSQHSPVYDKGAKTWGLQVTPPQAVPGMLPTGMAKPAKDDLFGGLGKQKPLVIDFSGIPPKK